MATYRGVEGIERLRQKSIKKIEVMVQTATINIALMIIEASPVGLEFYPSKKGGLKNSDPGQFKNSWNVTYNKSSKVINSGRGDSAAAGTDAYSSAQNTLAQYQMQEEIYVKNSTPQASFIEHSGWTRSEQPIRDYHGWSDKPKFGIVAKNADNAVAILTQAVRTARGVT